MNIVFLILDSSRCDSCDSCDFAERKYLSFPYAGLLMLSELTMYHMLNHYFKKTTIKNVSNFGQLIDRYTIFY